MPGFVIASVDDRSGGGGIDFAEVRAVRPERQHVLTFGRYEARLFEPARVSDWTVVETDSYVAAILGIVLNSPALSERAGASDLSHYVRLCLDERNTRFFQEMRGVFSGFVFDRNAETLTFYTNHTGDSPVFYMAGPEGRMVVGSQLEYMYPYIPQELRRLNRNAVYSMLTYGFMAGDETYLEGVQRLAPGSYATLRGTAFKINTYHQFRRDRYDLTSVSLDMLVDELDDRFRTAIEREFDWDRANGKEHLVDLSGGLDSRMTTWVAREMGYSPIVNIAYSQSEYLDVEIAAEVAAELGNQLLVRMLDDASFLLEANLTTSLSAGLVLYAGITGGRQLLDSLNLDRFGLEHTGQLGGIIVGSFVSGTGAPGRPQLSGMYSSRLANKVDRSHLEQFDDHETYLLYQRGFNGTLGSHLVRRHYIDAVSPFLDVEFVEFCLSVPLQYRSDRSLYRTWLLRKYPRAAAFRWEKTNAALSAPPWRVAGRRLLKSGPQAVERFLRLPPRNGGLGRSMNPFEYWWRSRPDMRRYLSSVFLDGLSECGFDSELESDIREFYRTGSALEKAQAITAVLGARLALQ